MSDHVLTKLLAHTALLLQSIGPLQPFIQGALLPLHHVLIYSWDARITSGKGSCSCAARLSSLGDCSTSALKSPLKKVPSLRARAVCSSQSRSSREAASIFALLRLRTSSYSSACWFMSACSAASASVQEFA